MEESGGQTHDDGMTPTAKNVYARFTLFQLGLVVLALLIGLGFAIARML